jgi:lipopolysaccharide heptosyltransferase II
MSMSKLLRTIKVRAIRAVVALGKKLLPRREPESGSSRFLIVTTTGIGDTLWATPPIAALRRKYPAGYIAVLTNPSGAELLKGNPAINNLFIFRRGAAGVMSLLPLIQSLRKEMFGKIFIFHASDRIVWPICSLAGAAEIIGFKGHSKDLDFILTKMIVADSTIHGVENRFLMLADAGVQKNSESLSVCLKKKDEEEAINFLEKNGIDLKEELIGLHPGAQKAFKCWPAEYFIETGNILRVRYGCRIVVTGDKEEEELAEKVASGIEAAKSSAGQLTIRGSAALIERMSLFITNDTGPMHIAFALKTPTIALFSPTDPALCGPYKAEKALALSKNTTCVPCIGKKCYNSLCLAQISPREVVEAAENILGSRDNR